MRPYHSRPPTRADHRTWPVPTQRQLRIAEYFVVRHLGSSATTGCGSACSVRGGRSVLAVSVFGDWLRGQLRDGWTNATIATPVQFALDM